MVYRTRLAAYLSLMEFSPAMRALHHVVPATRYGVPVGFTVVMRS